MGKPKEISKGQLIAMGIVLSAAAGPMLFQAGRTRREGSMFERIEPVTSVSSNEALAADAGIAHAPTERGPLAVPPGDGGDVGGP